MAVDMETRRSALSDALEPDAGLVAIETSTMGGAFTDLLKSVYGQEGQTIQIAGASVESEEDGCVRITGRATVFGVSNMPVSACFKFEKDGSVSTRIEYTLIGGSRSATAWKFSDSFPYLPGDNTDAANVSEPLLDTIRFSAARFVVVESSRVDEVLGVDLAAGLNFVGTMRPSGPFGVLQSGLASGKDLTLFGRMLLGLGPRDAERKKEKRQQRQQEKINSLKAQIAAKENASALAGKENSEAGAGQGVEKYNDTGPPDDGDADQTAVVLEAKRSFWNKFRNE